MGAAELERIALRRRMLSTPCAWKTAVRAPLSKSAWCAVRGETSAPTGKGSQDRY